MVSDALVNDPRFRFFGDVLEAFRPGQPCRLLVITHCLEDRPALFRALEREYFIARIVPIPYSVDPATHAQLSRRYAVSTMSLDAMLNGDALLEAASRLLDEGGPPLAVIEIGGYFAPIGNELRRRYGRSFLGTVEDTENGHRRYEEQGRLDFPVVSVARSKLKMIEDRLIGPSVVFSIEGLIRQMGHVLAGMTVGVIGYGRIGSSVANALRSRCGRVITYDRAPSVRARAFADGFQSPARERFLAAADLLIGATGTTSLGKESFGHLKDGAILASASSKRVEFDVAALRAISRSLEPPIEGVQCLELSSGNKVYLLERGFPDERRVLGAHRQGAGHVLDVAGGHDGAVLSQERGTDDVP
jgi:adenosylhomocysteinase